MVEGTGAGGGAGAARPRQVSALQAGGKRRRLGEAAADAGVVGVGGLVGVPADQMAAGGEVDVVAVGAGVEEVGAVGIGAGGDQVERGARHVVEVDVGGAVGVFGDERGRGPEEDAAAVVGDRPAEVGSRFCGTGADLDVDEGVVLLAGDAGLAGGADEVGLGRGRGFGVVEVDLGASADVRVIGGIAGAVGLVDVGGEARCLTRPGRGGSGRRG